MKKRIGILIPLIVLVSFCLGMPAQAQEDDQPLDDKFVAALVMMAVNHNMMAGDNEIRDLTALHGFVNDYYDERIFTVGADSTAGQWLHLQQSLLTKTLENEIEVKSGKKWLQYFLTIFTDDEYLNLTREGLGLRRWQLVSGSDDPPTDYIQNLDSSVMTDIEKQVDLLLDIKTVSTHPSVAPAIADSSGWDFSDVGTSTAPVDDSTAPISPVDEDEVDDEDENDSSVPSADFWDQGEDDGDSGGSSVDEEPQYKPLRFTNNGFDAVTVVVETYEPASGYSAAKPAASTVVYPESNSSAYLELPLGTYTFCYYWQLDQDFNNDDYFDYHHRTTASFSLNNNSSNNPESAIAVTLSPDSEVSNPNGKCGESVPEPSNSDNSNLTPEEQAAQNLHTLACVFTGADGNTSSWTEESKFEFTEEGVYYLVPAQNVSAHYIRVSSNYFTYDPNGPALADTTLTFLANGVTFSGSFNGGYTTVCTRVD